MINCSERARHDNDFTLAMFIPAIILEALSLSTQITFSSISHERMCVKIAAEIFSPCSVAGNNKMCCQA